jgi:type II secretory pathway pseudopilin PulG
MSARDRLVVTVVVALAAIAASWMLVIQPKRQEASSLSGQISAEQTQLQTARGQVDQGQAALRSFATEYGQLVRMGEAVPPDDDVPSLIFQIQNAAKAAHVDFRNLQLAAASATASTPTTPSATTPTTAGASARAAAPVPPGAAVGPAGLPAEQFSFTFRGNYFHLADFLDRLKKFVVDTNDKLTISGRLMTLNAINLTAGPAGFPQMNATVQATTYMIQPSQLSLGGAMPALPAGSSTQPGSSSTSSTSTPAAAITPPKP